MKIELGGIGTLLFIVFMVLKLCHVIAWSWWWVCAPIWIPLSIAAVLLILAGIFALVASKLQ